MKLALKRKKAKIACFMFLSAFILASCSSSKTISDTISEHNKSAIYEKQNIEKLKTYPELIDLLGKSVVVFSVFPTEDIPNEFAGSLHRILGETLQANSLFTKQLNDSELNSLLAKNGNLAQAKDLYLDSLTVVSVSDKDISNPLGRYLGVDNFLIFQLDKWPCFDCKNQDQLRMKLKLVDANSSYILWTSSASMTKLKPKEIDNIEAIADKLMLDLVEQFQNRFKKKWHRKQYDNLSESVS